MNQYVKQLMKLAERYVSATDLPDFVCAFAGGSVGRGDADAYSDLDLNIYLETPVEGYSRNVRFQDEIIQLHVHAFPTFEAVQDQPWDFRFTKEARPVSDPSKAFDHFKIKTVRYLDSPAGRKKMFHQAEEVVNQRKKWATDSMNEGNFHSAGVAGIAALIDAGFLQAYFTSGCVSSTSFVETFKRSTAFKAICAVLPISQELLHQDSEEILKKVHRYLVFLRKSAIDPGSFQLAIEQETLVKRKVDRAKRFGDELDLFFLLYGEMFWFYLSGSGGGSLEHHLTSLPESIRVDLNRFGFIEMNTERVERCCELADHLVNEVREEFCE